MRVIPRAIAAGLFLVAGVAAAAAPAKPQPPFPNLEMRSLKDGSLTELTSFVGHPVLLTFWASWCGPCRMELPEIEKLYNTFGDDGFVVAAVNMDRSAEIARMFVTQVGITLPVYRLDAATMRRLGVKNLPTNVLLDPSGHVLQIYEGYDPAVVKDIRRRLEQMLQGSPAGSTGTVDSARDAEPTTHG